MTARLAPALTGPSAPTSPSATGRRPGSTSGDDFSALLGAAGDGPAAGDARPELLETSRRLARPTRPESRQEVRSVEERPADRAAADRAAADRRTADRAAADRAAADRRAGDDRRADDRRAADRPAERRVDERRADERRAEAQRAAGDERARRESVERRQQEDASARADRSALRRESQRRVGADDAREQAGTPVGRDEQAQAPRGEGEATAELGQTAVVPSGDAVAVPVECGPSAALVDPALLALAGVAPDAATTQGVAGNHEGPAAGVAGLVPDLAAAPVPQSATVQQPVVDGEAAPVAVPVVDAGAASAAVTPTDRALSRPTGTAAGQSVPLADAATTTVATSLGPVDVTLLDGATPLPGGTGGGAGSEGGPQDQSVEPPVVPGPGDDAVAAGVEDVDVAVQAGPATVPSQRAEAAVSAAGRAEVATPADAPTAEAAVERTNLGPTVVDLARAAHRDGSGATRVVIRLDPPELGTVTIAVTVRGGDVRVSLLAEAGVVPVLDSRRDDVHRALSEAGLALGGYDVSSGSHQGQERQQEARDRAAAAGRPWRALGPEMDFERAAAVDRAARGVWL